jgi:hypothetical protein
VALHDRFEPLAGLAHLACPLVGPSHFNLIIVLLFFSGAVLALVFASNGGLMATTLSAFRQAKAAAWNQAGNFGGGVLGAALVALTTRCTGMPTHVNERRITPEQ